MKRWDLITSDEYVSASMECEISSALPIKEVRKSVTAFIIKLREELLKGDTTLTPSADVQERAKGWADKHGKGEYGVAYKAYLAGASSGMQWVKASERLPNHHKEICVKYHGRYYAGKRNHDSVHPAIYIEMPSGSVTTRDCEYLDESSPSSMQEENERLRKALEECREYFDDKADVDHEGTPLPNKEAKLLSTINEVLK